MTSDSLDRAKSHGMLPEGLGWRVFTITAIALVVLGLAAAIWFAIDVLLLLFAAVLLANLLMAPTDWLVGRGLPRGGALALVVAATVLLLAALGAALVPSVAAQVPELASSLGDAVERLRSGVGLSAWAKEIGSEIDIKSMLPSPTGIIGGATGVISSTFGAFANMIIVIVIALYLTASPGLYLDGAVRLIPHARRARVRSTLVAVGHTLRWWFAGQLVSMSVVGGLTFLGLTLLGVPLALVLAVIAFVLAFVPYIGPILAGILVVLVAFTVGSATAAWAILLYAGIQSVESYLVTPMIQRRSVDLPPALTVVAQVLLGVLLGGLGIMLATPLAAAGMVAVERLYLQGVLGEEGPD
jgi:predicted PurR-regulated permease PerM